MTRDEAYKLMTEMVENPNLRKHAIAVEAIMRTLCNYLKDRSAFQGNPLEPEEFNEEEWAIVGLLHDADYELIGKDPTRHTLVTEEKLRPLGASERIINGIKAHHEGVKPTRDNLLEKAVYAADELSGLITAVTLVRPDKQSLTLPNGKVKKLSKLKQVTVENVMKKFPEKSFAAGARREQILACESELNIPLAEFVTIALGAMQSVSDQLGL